MGRSYIFEKGSFRDQGENGLSYDTINFGTTVVQGQTSGTITLAQLTALMVQYPTGDPQVSGAMYWDTVTGALQKSSGA